MPPSPAQEAFGHARTEFLASLTDSKEYDFSQFTSIDEVYEATEKIQEQQDGDPSILRGLKKIKPYLECLSQFSEVIDTFVQVKPDILALIWGPIKLLLQISSSFERSYDKVLEAMGQIGQYLPQFRLYGDFFRTNDRVQHVLCIFYKDILDFHIIALNFFKKKGWRVIFESLWPRSAAKISIVLNNIALHKLLMDSEVTLANIGEAYTARSLAYEEYEKNQTNWQRQRFESAKLSLSPRFFDLDLERIRERCCEDTGHWLWKDDAFCRWYDPNNLSMRILWLVGIPGAGKTFLTSTLIQRFIMSTRNVVFAFLNYQNSPTTTTLEILHSFIFQLVLDHPDLQATLSHAHESNYRQLSSSTEFVQNLLCDIMKCIGTTYIIVDGLDEASESEKKKLVKILLAISKSCVEVKILFSSREDADLSPLLKAPAVSICIGRKNTKDINKYLNSATESWLATLDISPIEVVEIKRMLEPIAVISEGMFLYARLVVADLVSRGNMQEIREEVRNLPDGLDEAFGRITSRIDNSRKRDRLEARKILEWIGCSKVPLRVIELEHALIIRSGDRSLAYDRKAFKNMIQLCGPIIEIQGELVVYVHFTVKEYLFGTQSDYYLEETEAHRNIATSCISYLGFDYFDINLPDTKVKKYILMGDYALQQYAESYWVYHAERGADNLDLLESSETFCESLVRFLDKSRNPDFKDCSENILVATETLEPFKKHKPLLYRALSLQIWFMNKKQSQLSEADGELWVNSDPLLISKSCLKIRRLFETLICKSKNHFDGCHCEKLRKFYGKQIYKCNKSYCPLFHTGFENYSDRDSHILCHERPFKCSFRNCDFSEIGFTSQSLSQQHSLDAHQNENQNSISTSTILEKDFSQMDINQVLYDAVEAGELNYVCSLMQQISSPPPLELMHLALRGSSAPIAMLLLQEIAKTYDIYDVDRNILVTAIDGANPEIVASFIEAVGMPPGTTSNLLEAAILNRSPQIIKLLVSHGVKRSEEASRWSRDIRNMINKGLSHDQELEVMECIEELGYANDESKLTETLRTVVMRKLSCEMIRLLLNQGANINVIRTRKSQGSKFFRVPRRTPLQIACARTDKRSANIIRFLLLNGANPSARLGSDEWSMAKNLRGATNISKWLGISWDELVKETREARESGRAEDEIQVMLEEERTKKDSYDREHGIRYGRNIIKKPTYHILEG